jgi:serine/threonine protein phosphatase PrpC
MSKKANKTTGSNSIHLSIQAWVKSDVGRVRKNNEDNFLADTINGLFVVADGMGGHEHGELASQRAVESIRNYIHNAMSGIKAFSMDPSPERRAWLEQIVVGAIQAANLEVYQLAEQKGARENMGTTLSMLLFVSGEEAIIGHVGDSRIYRIRNKEVNQITTDQTLLQEQLRKGLVRPEDAANVPFGNTLMQAVGYRANVHPDIFWLDTVPGDQFLLCSDGLSNYLIEDEIVTVFSQARGEQIVPRLIACANARGGRDNITAIVTEIEDPTASMAATQLDLSTDLLSQCPLLEGLGMGQSMQILPLGELRLFIKDEIIQAEGNPSVGLVMILAGRIGLYRRGTWISTAGSGDHFGDIEFFDQRAASESAICEEETRVIIFDHEKLRAFMEQNLEVSQKLLWNLGRYQAKKMRNYEGRLAQLLGQN